MLAFPFIHSFIRFADTLFGNFNDFWNYGTPLIGAYIADAFLGRFMTITCAAPIYIAGLFLLVLSCTPLAFGDFPVSALHPCLPPILPPHRRVPHDAHHHLDLPPPTPTKRRPPLLLFSLMLTNTLLSDPSFP